MLVTKINFNINQTAKNYQAQPIKRNNEALAEFKLPNFGYKPVSFGQKSQKNCLIEKIGKDNFPSEDIYTMFSDHGKKCADLQRIHVDYYENLKLCQTLDEAKFIYPEFSEVKDAKDLTEKDISSSAALSEIKDGKNPDVSLDDLSLKFIQKYYSELKGFGNNSESYFGYSEPTVKKLAETLNIPVMNKDYFSAVSGAKRQEA